VAVIVLGYPTWRNGELHPLQRWRIAIARRTVSVLPAATVVFTGGLQPDGRTEAQTMAEAAQRDGGFGGPVLTEDRATSTWENVGFALPMVPEAKVIMFASDPLHARRARRYVAQLFPERMDQLARADDYRVFEACWLKVATAAYETQAAGRARWRRSGR